MGRRWRALRGSRDAGKVEAGEVEVGDGEVGCGVGAEAAADLRIIAELVAVLG
jgi:hypothetical protein